MSRADQPVAFSSTIDHIHIAEKTTWLANIFVVIFPLVNAGRTLQWPSQLHEYYC
jgi:hypothetical protein